MREMNGIMVFCDGSWSTCPRNGGFGAYSLEEKL